MKKFIWSWQFAMYLYNYYRLTYEDAFNCALEFHKEYDDSDWMENCPQVAAMEHAGKWEC